MIKQHTNIRLLGARHNNLQNLCIDIPVGRLTVVTGLSGTGKSSLVMDTLHAEGQRRYVETFSAYTRQFMDRLARPQVDAVENIRPSIAIAQTNTVKTSRSTVGTMTELTDYGKIWFCHHASLFNPSTCREIRQDHPASIWQTVLQKCGGKDVLVVFTVSRPGRLSWKEIVFSLQKQGFTRAFYQNEIRRLEEIPVDGLEPEEGLQVIQDRVSTVDREAGRFMEACRSALHFGKGLLKVFQLNGSLVGDFCEGLRDPETGQLFKPATPALFSFNSPVGACPKCRGFGRIITIDPRLVIPDPQLSLNEGAVRAFQGAVYGESQRDLLRACRREGIPVHVPFRDLNEAQRRFVFQGEPGYVFGSSGSGELWYGIDRFFEWLESTSYKMHVRVFLSKYRSYVTCPDCGGSRLQPEALNWKWQGHTLPDLYRLPVAELYRLLSASPGNDLASRAILTRLGFLQEVGLGYLTLDRSSRTLSGGEVERVNLTSCLGTGLTETLFVLDEPSVGLHACDTDRLIRILRRLVEAGNTVVVVEHDESIMRAADHLIEMGPRPGAEGGKVVFQGPPSAIVSCLDSPTGACLSGRYPKILENAEGGAGEEAGSPFLLAERALPFPKNHPRSPASIGITSAPANDPVQDPRLYIYGATRHNIRDLDLSLPLRRFVVLSGVSGSGKSTLLNNVIHQGWLAQKGGAVEEPAEIRSIESSLGLTEVVLVDQSPVSRTPRSNAILFVEAWDRVRKLFAQTEAARLGGLNASSFSFNSGQGRCEHCQGLGYERIEMQFMADLFAPCPVCEGKRFRSEVLAITWNGQSVDAILKMTVDEGITFFREDPSIVARLLSLQEVGLGYLPLGQPLNTLSGGESQRLKLVKYMGKFGSNKGHALLLLDEPTTGLHRCDVFRLLEVLRRLVTEGHSLVVIEHHLDVIRAADWVIEMGPGAGSQGGRIIFSGHPQALARSPQSPTAPYLREELRNAAGEDAPHEVRTDVRHDENLPKPTASLAPDLLAEPVAANQVFPAKKPREISELVIAGARENNLRNISLRIRHGEITVLTGVSGSGKSTLAFDIIFAEGQRRFMESMSPWARQYVEQLPKPEVDLLTGIPPTVAIEQRVTRGTRKSTVATITEIAQYLRLLFAKVGVQHSIHSGRPLVAQKASALLPLMTAFVEKFASHSSPGEPSIYLCAPLIRSRKGHHEPLANWAKDHHYQTLRIDGDWVPLARFKKLDRYKEHNIELVTASFGTPPDPAQDQPLTSHTLAPFGNLPGDFKQIVEATLRLGNGSCFFADAQGAVLSWFSTSRSDPVTGEAYPDPDPKQFSWNSPQGWCPTCHGHGELNPQIRKLIEDNQDESFVDNDQESPASGEGPCPDCQGERLNPISRAVRLPLQDGSSVNLPELLRKTPADLLQTLLQVATDPRSQRILDEVVPEIRERLAFMENVGLGYLSLDRSTQTLSGGEAQRIRLAAQLGSNLCGVLYVLDEPSIGLHPHDNLRLLESLQKLRNKGNTLLIVEHDTDTMLQADRIIDLGPEAGRHGGRIVVDGSLDEVKKHPDSLTGAYLREGIAHPLRGTYRSLPPKPPKRPRIPSPGYWMHLTKARLRNLKEVDLDIPLGRLTMICGLSGAGKSTLVRDLLLPAVRHAIATRNPRLGGTALALPGCQGAAFSFLHNAHVFSRVVEVDQSPIGKTPRSTPATYLGAFDLIRAHFANLPEARMRALNPGFFSFNTKGGRCETCKGAGRIKLEMSFMPDTYVTCEACSGSRYDQSLVDILWNDRNIAQVLQMTFREALPFFDFDARLQAMLALMEETGLGYLQLGQSSPTLSGGEAQRLKLVTELAASLATKSAKPRSPSTNSSQAPKKSAPNPLPTPSANLYLLEEPTIGLHPSDCAKLIHLLHRLVDQGHTVIVIEHHPDLLKEADYIVEIGPEGGQAGGHILYQGSLQGLQNTPSSPTAPFLRQ